MRKYDEFEKWKMEESIAWLDHVRGLWRDEQRINATIEDTVKVIRRLAEPRGIDYARPAVATSRNVDVIADVVAAMDELAEQWRDTYLNVQAERKEASDIIDKLGDARHRQVVTLYYLDGWSWKRVSLVTNFCEDYCYDLRDQAAIELHDHLPPGWRTPIPTAQ